MYIAGGPIEEDQDFYGRSELVTALLEGEARRVFLVGLRRTGKTSVLKALERRAADRGLAPLFLQLQGLGSGAPGRGRSARRGLGRSGGASGIRVVSRPRWAGDEQGEGEQENRAQHGIGRTGEREGGERHDDPGWGEVRQ